MKGFSNRWKDLPDYILGVTHEIWEGRDIASLRASYGRDIIVRSPAGVSIGNTAVISATMATLAEFPDRTLLGEDVIWSGTPETGMLSSHRLLSTATHLCDGMYGKATGKKLTYRIIADCHAINDQIDDEWLVRDQGAIVRQMGFDVVDYARRAINQRGGPDKAPKPFSPAIDKPGPYKGRGNDNVWGKKYADILQRIMFSEFSIVPKEYDRACHLELPGGVTGHSHSDADRFWMGLRAAFPDAIFTVDHVIGREDPLMPPRAALRWSLQGRHSGWGAFGAPTDAEVYVLGLSHAEFGPWGLRREYVLFDETAIWTQILLKTGDL
jgi:predicted ester cyclase